MQILALMILVARKTTTLRSSHFANKVKLRSLHLLTTNTITEIILYQQNLKVNILISIFAPKNNYFLNKKQKTKIKNKFSGENCAKIIL